MYWADDMSFKSDSGGRKKFTFKLHNHTIHMYITSSYGTDINMDDAIDIQLIPYCLNSNSTLSHQNCDSRADTK